VKARSKVMPSRHMDVAAVAASFLPSAVSSTSAQPVKRDASFQVLCPCRRKTMDACVLLGRSNMEMLGTTVRAGRVEEQGSCWSRRAGHVQPSSAADAKPSAMSTHQAG